MGLVGETQTATLLYLALSSRLLDDPVSVVVKGTSSSGKSFLVETVLKLFPPSAYLFRTSLSQRALVYTQEDFRHRTIVLAEAEGGDDEYLTYFIRTLLSEKKVAHEVTVKDRDGQFRTELVLREGPTNFVMTTTRLNLHPENETRMLSVAVHDDAEQTRKVLLGIAQRRRASVALEPWIALQESLAEAVPEVEVQFAPVIAELTDPMAPRVRRDFVALLSLVQSAALIRSQFEGVVKEGMVLATVEDYEFVYELAGRRFSEMSEEVVSDEVKAVVECVERLGNDRQYRNGVSVVTVGEVLGVHKSTASRRIQIALDKELLINEEPSRGRPARLRKYRETSSREIEVFPSPAILRERLDQSR